MHMFSVWLEEQTRLCFRIGGGGGVEEMRGAPVMYANVLYNDGNKKARLLNATRIYCATFNIKCREWCDVHK